MHSCGQHPVPFLELAGLAPPAGVACQIAKRFSFRRISQNHRKTIGKPWENGGSMGFNEIYLLVISYIAIEHGPVESRRKFESFPIHSMVI